MDSVAQLSRRLCSEVISVTNLSCLTQSAIDVEL